MKFHWQLLQVDEAEITLPNGRRSTWETAAYRGRVTAVAVLGFLPSTRQLVLVRNYRPALAAWKIEAAGGLAMPDEVPVDAARREFKEETGYQAERMHAGPTLHLQPGLGYFLIVCFVAEAVSCGPQRLDPNECITPVLLATTPAGIEGQKPEIDEPVSLLLLDYFVSRYLRRT